MFDKSSLLLIPILGIMIALSLWVYNVNAIAVNNTDYSMQVPNGWVYRENFINDNDTILTPNEFADPLITGNVSSLTDILHDRVMVEVEPDLTFPVKNAPLEMYVKHALRYGNGLDLTSENATIGGERAIKVFFNSTDQANKLGKTNVPVSLVTLSYFVMHDDQPYNLNYITNAKNYQKYLPQFEQMVKSFKFTK
jgi:hypothetical protein